MDEFATGVMILALVLTLIGLIGLAVIAITTAFGVSYFLGFLTIFLVGLLTGVIASSFSN